MFYRLYRDTTSIFMRSTMHDLVLRMMYYNSPANESKGGLTHWGRVTHICVGNLTTIGSDNGLSPGRRQAIIWTNAGILLTGPLWTNFSEILIEIPTFSFKKMRLKVSSAKWRPFCLGLNELNDVSLGPESDCYFTNMGELLGHLCYLCENDHNTTVVVCFLRRIHILWCQYVNPIINRLPWGKCHWLNFAVYRLFKIIRVGSRRCHCLVTWFCYHLITKPVN